MLSDDGDGGVVCCTVFVMESWRALSVDDEDVVCLVVTVSVGLLMLMKEGVVWV